MTISEQLADATVTQQSQESAPPMGDHKMLTVSEVAEYLRISERTLWNRTTPRGPIAATRTGGRVLYAWADVQGYLESCKVEEVKHA